MQPDPDAGLLAALLKHWRGRRGLSQLDLGIAADVSARHISFLETGRSVPSTAMVLRLAATLDVPLRHVNTMLVAAGHDPVYDVTASLDALPTDVQRALRLLGEHHDPFPLIVVDRVYDVLMTNRAGAALLAMFVDPDDDATPNLARLTFGRAASAIVNLADVGREILWRIQREVLDEPDRGALRALLDELLAMPGVEDDWREPDLSASAAAVVAVHLRTPVGQLRFVTAVTALQAPQDVLVDELRIETWLPADEPTAAACVALLEDQGHP